METQPFFSDLDESLPGQILLRKSGACLSRLAIVDGSRNVTYGELRGSVLFVAEQLREAGFGPGDRIVLIAGRNLEYVVGFFAVTLCGAIAVPMDQGMGRERRRFILEETRPLATLTCVASGAEPYEEKRGASVPLRWNSSERRVELDPPSGGLLWEEESQGVEEEPFLASSSLVLSPQERVAVLLYTSGSTGKPKGVPLGHGQLLHIARVLADKAGIGESHKELSLGPLSHSGSWQRVSATLLRGGCVVLAQGLPSVPSLLEDVRDHQITGFFSPPPLLKALLRADPARVRACFGTCRSIETASAPLSSKELSDLLKLISPTEVLVQYGLTECSRAVMLDAQITPEKLHTVGRPTDGVELALLSSEGGFAEMGEVGEILLRGPQRLVRYWSSTDCGEERFFRDWLRTGDMGSVDEDGYLTLKGRRDDQINCGGFSFFPAEIEVELLSLAGIEDLLVAGVPDPRGYLTEVPWAFVVPDESESWCIRTFLSEARRRLPPFMAPRGVSELSSLPLSGTGKPDRRRLVEWYRAQCRKDSSWTGK